MENNLSPKVFQRANPAEDVIEAEWVDVQASSPQTDPVIVYLVTQPYRSYSDEQSSPVPQNPLPNPETEETFLDTLLTPWGIAGLLCLLMGNMLLIWGQRSPRPAPTALTNAVTRVDVSPVSTHSATFPLSFGSARGQSLDVSQLSRVKMTVSGTSAPSMSPQSGVRPPTGMSLFPAIPPTSVGSSPLPHSLPMAPSLAMAPAIAKASIPASPPRSTFPVVPIVLQPRSMATLPPPPPPSLPASIPTAPTASVPPYSAPTATAPTASVPTPIISNHSTINPATINPGILTHQRPPQSFNQKTREQLLNLANQLPSSAENPGIVNELRQEIQKNQGN